MRLELGPFVEGNLEEIGDFIALDNPERAVSFIHEIRERFHAITDNPLIFRLRPEVGEDARLSLHGHYVILFRIDANVVRIERVAFGGRELSNLYGEPS